VESGVNVDGLAHDLLQLLKVFFVSENVKGQMLGSLSALIFVLGAQVDVS